MRNPIYGRMLSLSWLFFSCLLLMITVLLAACQLSLHRSDHASNSATGALLVVISQSEQITTAGATYGSREVTSYDIAGSGPESETFSRPDVSATASSVEISDLVIGEWVITVDARNADGHLLGRGTAPTVIESGQTAEVAIVVSPGEGQGTVQVEVSWTQGVADAITDLSVEMELFDGDSFFESSSPTPSDNSVSETFSDVPEASYELRVRLLNGTAEVWGDVAAVNVFTDSTTIVTYEEITESDLQNGSVSLTITPPDHGEDATVEITGARPHLPTGTSMTVSASVPPSLSSPSYRWYLDGTPISEATDPSVSVGEDLLSGGYKLDVLVSSEGGRLDSNGVGFTSTAYARTPVFFVHGYGMAGSSWETMMSFLEVNGPYPSQFLRAITLSPNDGGNVEAADQIATAVEGFLDDVNALLAEGGSDIPEELPAKTKVDVVSHSMGGLSSRYFAARYQYTTPTIGGATSGAELVNSWISIAGANHGTQELEGYGGQGEEDSVPPFAADATESAIQIDLNGAYDDYDGDPETPRASDDDPAPRAAGNDTDETPYGIGTDSTGVGSVVPDESRRIYYATIRTIDDVWISPDSSTILDGTGGISIDIPDGLTAEEDPSYPGNFIMTDAPGHDQMLSDAATMELVLLLLNANQL